MIEQRSLMVVAALAVLVGVLSSTSSALELNCDKMENCTCPEFYIISSDRSQCLQRLALPYSACNASEQCADRMVIGAICANNICACAEGFHYLHGRCWKSVGLGGGCSTSEQCHVNYDHQSVTCNLTVGVCECSLGYYSRGGIDCRREAEAIGESCGIDADCRFEGATCAGNYTCQLKSVASIYPSDKELFALSEDEQDDDAESPDSTVDGSVVKVGDSCTDNSSCSGLAYSNCFLGECACLPGYYALQGDTCYRELGGTCAKDSDCVRADDVICLDKICACAAGSVAIKDNRRCKKMKMFNNTCSNLYPETCSSYGLTCGCLPDSDSKLKCICAQGYHYENDDQLCWVSKGLNSSCTDNKDCKVGIGSAICVESGEDDRMCACTPGTNISADGQNCVSVTGLESACSTDDDCSPLGSYVSCYSGSCSCDSNYYKNPSTNAGEPLCLPGIDGKCSEDDCQLDNTSCSSFNVCSCDESFTSSEKKDRCLKVAVEEGDNCTEHTQCSVKLGSSQCVDGSCVCLEHYHYMNGSCWETRSLGESCTSVSECLKESSQNSVECRNNKCQCGFNYKENNNACESNNDGIVLRASNIFPLFLLSFSPLYSYSRKW